MFIIESILDNDFYKFTMGNLIFKRYPNVNVTYTLTNRAENIHLSRFIKEDDLRRELDHVREIKINNTELHYLRGTNEYGDRMFEEDYLEFLKNLRLPEYNLERQGLDYKLEFSGRWSEAIYWETMALAIISELYSRGLMQSKSQFYQDCVYAKGKLKLAKKIKAIKGKDNITITDFGTRRRFNKQWHDYLIRVLKDELPGQFLGTSNTHLAMKYGILPMGTSAHELFMVMASISGDSDEDIRSSHNKVLQDWWDLYGWGLSIALTDTFGTDFFFRDMTYEQAKNWKGLRHDSGDPIEFGEKAIKFYEDKGIDPREKFLIFSDGLNAQTILKISEHFKDRIRVSFGWGTNLTNDLGFKALPIVIKVSSANGRPTVKLTDNLAKAMGSKEDIERYKRIFGYTHSEYQKLKY
ncbi:MAG: nicotinate phosphoribosyltransferase [bacterium]